jgi:signal transduction histidine kinase
VLELAKVSAADQSMQAIELSGVIAEVQEDYLKAISDIGGSLTVTEELPTILGNKTQIYQIFSNLVNNAVKYRAQDRALEISIGVHQARSPRRSIITVTDNGRGIPTEKIPLLFKPFQRIGEEAIEGTGVGLACVHRLVEKMGGEITVSSEEGRGSTFTLELRRGKAVHLSSELPG